MKRISFVCAALLGLTGFAAPRAEAQICLDLVDFVDRLELNISGDRITGWWRNWDGRGSDVPVQGLIKDVLAFPCHQGPSFQLPDPQYPPKAFIACLPDLGCITTDFNDEWYFLLDGVENSYDLGFSEGGVPPPGACAADDVEYQILLGPCPMEITLQNALATWEELATDALTIDYDGIIGDGTCVVPPETCPDTDIWKDDGNWVVTRSYKVEGDPVDCEDAATPAMGEGAGAGLRLFDDPVENHNERPIRECDIVFFEDSWDNAEGNACRDAGLYSEADCAQAYQMALVHEAGHCLGFGHSYLTRKTLDPLEQAGFFGGFGLDIDNLGAPALMSYDRPGSVIIGQDGLNPYDEAVYLYNYAVDPDQGSDDHFTASGTVTECGGDEIFGAGVLALEKVDANTLKPVQMSISGLDPLESDGAFRLDHLERSKDYRLIVVDVRDENQINANGWNYDLSAGAIPGLPAFRTDDWSEDNSGGGYKFEMRPFFTTGFEPTLTDLYEAPDVGDDLPIDDEDVCVEFATP